MVGILGRKNVFVRITGDKKKRVDFTEAGECFVGNVFFLNSGGGGAR